MSASYSRKAVIAAAALSGCFSSSAFTPFISAVTSNATRPDVGVTTGTTSVEVTGSDFSSSTVIYWNGQPEPTTFESSSAVRIALEKGETDVAGFAILTATNDGSLTSEPVEVHIVDADLLLSGLSPAQIDLGAPSTALTLTGTGFRPTSVGLWNGAPLQTTFVSSTKLTVQVPAALLAVAGDGLVQVSQPGCLPQTFCLPISHTLACSVGTATKTKVPQPAVDLAWDSTHALLFAALSQQFGASSVTALDPVSGKLGVSVPTSSEAQLSVSAQDQFLYVSLPSELGKPANRYPLPGLTSPVVLTPAAQFARVDAVAAAPGAPATAALLIDFNVSVVDDSVFRAKIDTSSRPDVLTWGIDASTLFGIDAVSPGLLRFSVDQTGVAKGVHLGSTPFVNNRALHFDPVTRRLYADSGESVDEQGLNPRLFTLPAQTSCAAAIDGPGGKAFFACTEFTLGLVVRSFDLATTQPLSQVLLDPKFGDGSSPPVRIVRWGASGLAVAKSTGVFLYNGAFVH